MADIFWKGKKQCVFCNKKKQLYQNLKKVLDMHYSYNCTEYVVKIS